jgi:hypothetical protein
MKKLYSLFALVALLFAACSDNASSVSGSTSVPNMGNNLTPPSAPVLCKQVGESGSSDAECYWSPEMWNRASGYRVRTGYDNGTNTSGIWTWSANPADAEISMDWPGNVTADYDSMALADVIDKCGGSLCGSVVFKGRNNIPNFNRDKNGVRLVYFDFYLAGKNASGNIESVDARDINGICLEYSGDFFDLELIPSDSIATIMGSYRFLTYLTGGELYPNASQDSREACFAWSAFTFAHAYYNGEAGYVPIEDVLAHLKGFRFVISDRGSYLENDEKRDFNIIGVGRYNTLSVAPNDLHPVDADCDPVSVTNTFCQCGYSEDELRSLSKALLLTEFLEQKNSFDPLTAQAEGCFDKIVAMLHRGQTMVDHIQERPCDNPLPKTFMCANGFESISEEYAEESAKNADASTLFYNQEKAVADSIFAQCMSLSE